MSDTTEHRMTITITPISEQELQAFVDDFRARFGRKHLVHVIGKQPRGSHLDDAPVSVSRAVLAEMAAARAHLADLATTGRALVDALAAHRWAGDDPVVGALVAFRAVLERKDVDR